MNDRPHINVLIRQQQADDVRRLRQRSAAAKAAIKSSESGYLIERLQQELDKDIAQVRRKWGIS